MNSAFDLDLSFLDATPIHWRKQPLWTLIQRRDVTGVPDAELLSVYRDHGVVPKSSRADNFNKPSEDLNTYRYVQSGDLVLNKMKTWQGSLAVSEFDGIVSPAYYVCRISNNVNTRFAHYLLRSTPYINLYRAASKGIRPNQWDLPFEEFRNLPMLLPPIEEQRRIANFLDAEVSRINKLEQQVQRVQLLATERARAIIDSEFSEFKDRYTIPASAACSAIIDCVNKTAPIADSDTPYRMIRTSNIRDGAVDLSETLCVERKVFELWNRRGTPKQGDILFTREAPLGQAGILTGDTPVFLGQRVVMYRANDDIISAELLLYNFLSSHVERQLRLLGAGSLHEHMRVGDCLKIRIVSPPRQLQEAIVTRIKRGREQTQGLKQLAQRQLSLLSERRQALITAAVTGKFDMSTASGPGVADGTGI
ncbi:hypothetical protein AB0H63_21200 [Micromonospora echinospora]|uniref:restriction endonuclease subunit S n=1 Tax=Micromonospora echinospora TaxID=1877 RepID=UPI0033C8D022